VTEFSTVPVLKPSHLFISTPCAEVFFAARQNFTQEQESRLMATQRDTRNRNGATPQQLSTSTHSVLSQSAIYMQDSPQVLASPEVVPADLTQLMDLLSLFVSVASTTPVAAWTVPTPLTTISSVKLFIISMISDKFVQLLSYSNTNSAPGDKGKETIEIDEADIVVDRDDEPMEIEEACLDLDVHKAMEAEDSGRFAPNRSPQKPTKRSNTSGPTKEKSAR